MTSCQDIPIYKKYRLLSELFHKLCGKLVKNLSKDIRNILIVKGFVRFALRWGNRKSPVVSTNILKTTYSDVLDRQKT